MESWNHIINTALLGTSKKELKKEDLDGELADSFDLIARNAESKEDAFLQSAALLYNYRQCGVQPLYDEQAALSIAATEEKVYATPAAHRVLLEILETGILPLMKFWLDHCTKSGKIVLPEMVPFLLDTAIKNKSLQDIVVDVCGKRGEWLRQFREDWNTIAHMDANEIWQTGSLAQRKTVLSEIRKADPAKGRELLQQTWSQENAAAKTELLTAFAINAITDDLPWLEKLLLEKSAKVKDEVVNILKSVPGSSIIQQYWEILKSSVHITTSKGLLGFGSKSELQIKLTAVEETVFKTGILQLSNQAGTTDESFILYQLITYIPPHFWTEHLQLEPKKVIELFLKNDQHKYFIHAISEAAARFKDLPWIRTIIELNGNALYSSALNLLPQKEVEKYALEFLKYDVEALAVITALQEFIEEWSLEFSNAVLAFTSKNPYRFNKVFYSNIIHLLPLSLTHELDKIETAEGYRNLWQNISEHISKLLSLKSQTIKAFNE